MTDSQVQTAAGIEALIERLTREGVDAGHAEAERIVSEAEKRAADIVHKAQADAEATTAAASKEAERLSRGGEEALKVAMRDAVLDLKTQLSNGLSEQVRGAVRDMTRDEDMLRQMILAVAKRAREEALPDDTGAMEIVLPRSVVALDELRRNPEDLREGSLTHFVATMGADLLRKGVTFSRASDDDEGIKIRLVDSGVVVDLTDRAVADVLLRHLQPRFRALLEGVVS